MKGNQNGSEVPSGGMNLFGEMVLRTGDRPARPFLKWAGGKGQLLPEIEAAMPSWVHERDFTFVEPFVGSGAVLFWACNRSAQFDRSVRLNLYRSVQQNLI